MSEIVEQAQALDQRYRDDAYAAWVLRNKAPERDSRTHCVECEDPIPERRRQSIKGCLRCTECQQLFDRGRPR